MAQVVCQAFDDFCAPAVLRLTLQDRLPNLLVEQDQFTVDTDSGMYSRIADAMFQISGHLCYSEVFHPVVEVEISYFTLHGFPRFLAALHLERPSMRPLI